MKIYELQEKHYYGLLGLSEPMQTEEELPYKLSNTEKKYFLEETNISENIQHALKEAMEYFNSKFNNGKVYYRSSPWNTGMKVHCMEFEKVLNNVVGGTLTQEVNA